MTLLPLLWEAASLETWTVWQLIGHHGPECVFNRDRNMKPNSFCTQKKNHIFKKFFLRLHGKKTNFSVCGFSRVEKILNGTMVLVSKLEPHHYLSINKKECFKSLLYFFFSLSSMNESNRLRDIFFFPWLLILLLVFCGVKAVTHFRIAKKKISENFFFHSFFFRDAGKSFFPFCGR